MQGTEKQIQWAESIKADLIRYIEPTREMIAKFSADDQMQEEMKVLVLSALDRLGKSENAQDWIAIRSEKTSRDRKYVLKPYAVLSAMMSNAEIEKVVPDYSKSTGVRAEVESFVNEMI